jgi:hypothetical protein
VTALQAQNSGGDGAENTHKNTGASGYVEENTGNLKTDSAAVPSASVCQPMPEAAPPHDNVTESKAVQPAVTLTGLLPGDSQPAAPRKNMTESAAA